jgi:glycosyltransferase involved in cell wall biosynthesis
MDENNQVLSHQIEIVNLLSKYFEKVTVLTGATGKFTVNQNVSVISVDWTPDRRVYNSIKFILCFFKLIKKNNFNSIFSHMTVVQSFLISPLTKYFKIPHYLWYAHKKNSLPLRVVRFLANGIITSTSGSCPLKGKNIFVVGQSIDLNKFHKKQSLNFPISKLVHIGRFDPIKNIEQIIISVEKVRNNYPDLNLEIIGTPSTELSKNYSEDIMKRYGDTFRFKWLKFTPHLSRKFIPEILNSKDCFIHAFQGSLDKSVLEATAMMVPVVTNNYEYLKEFGSWNPYYLENTKIEDELNYLLRIPESSLVKELENRRNLVNQFHNSDSWIIRLVNVISN